MKQIRNLNWLLLVVVGFLSLCPVLMLLLGSFSKGLTAFGQFTLEKYALAYADPYLWSVSWNTLVFVLGSSLLSTVLALFLAYLNTRTDIPYKPVFTVLSIVPMMIPHLLFSASWALLLNPGNGMLNQIFQSAFGLEQAPLNIYSMWGMILVEGLLNMPIAYLIIAPAMLAFDPSLEEAARVSGSSTMRTLLRVTLPMLRPAILAALVLAIVRSLASYAVPRVLGTPGQVDVLATFLYDLISTGLAPDYGQAAAVGMSVLSAAIALIVLYRYLTRAGEKYVTVSARGFNPGVVQLGRARRPLLAVVAIISLLMVIMPVAVLVYTSLVPYVMAPSLQAFASMGLQHWYGVFQEHGAMLALRNTLWLAVVGATLGVALSLAIAYVVTKSRSHLATALETLSFLSFSFPGIVIGIGFMWFFVQTPLYATLTALLLAYIAAYLPYGIRPLTSAFVQIHSHLEESSLVCGASQWLTLRRIVVPLLVPGIVSAWILMATMFLRELTVSVVLSRPGTEVLAIQILGYADDGLWGKLSALGLFMIVLSTVLVLCAQYLGRRFSYRLR